MATDGQDDLRDENERLKRRVAELEARIADAALHEAMLESLPHKVFCKDLDGRFVMVNGEFAKLFGLKPADFVGKTDFDFVSHEMATKYRADDQRVVRSRTPVTLIEPNEMGAVKRFVEVSKAPLSDSDGNVIGVFGLFQDVTGRVRAESELRQSRKLLQAIMDNTPAVMTIKDAAGRYVMANRRFSEVFELSLPQVIGKTDHELFGDAVGGVYRKNDEQVLARGRAVELEETVTLPNGLRTFMLLKFPVETAGGQVITVGGISMDITERKQAERALKESEARKSAILDAALDCIITLDQEGRINEFNPAAEREFGWKRVDVLRRTMESLIAGHPDAGPIRWNEFTDSTRSMIGSHVEVTARRADGSVFPAEMGISMVLVRGEPQTTVTLRNMTRRKEADEAIRSQQKQLAEQAEQLELRNAELSKAYNELQDTESQLIHSEKMAAIGQLVAGLAHEINTPVAFVLTNLANVKRNIEDVMAFAQGMIELLPELRKEAPALAATLEQLYEEHEIEESGPEIRPLLDAAQRGMVRIKELVASLRAYSRIDLRSETAFEDLNEGLKATMVLLEPAKKSGVDVQFDLAELPRIECNLGKINQVFLNLLTNSIQALGNSGTIKVVTRAADGGVEVRVTDDGPGIPLTIQKRIFDPFFTTKPVGEGTGLGLSISRKIIEAHRGTLTLKSTPGEGAEFRIWLPLRQSPSGAPNPSPPADSEDSMSSVEM
jgi:two-component system NtrC family sensor kinase